jgi:hypothetical protein
MRRFLAAAVVGVLALAACSSNSSGSSYGGSTGAGSPSSETTSPSESASPSGESPSATESPSPSESPKPPLPTAVENPKQGGTYFGVYLAVGPATDPKLVTAAQDAAGLGYRAFPGDISCDHGAAEALGVSNDLFAVAIYFKFKAQAKDLLPWLDEPPLAIAQVQTYCAD